MKDIFARMRMNIIFNRVSIVMRIIRITLAGMCVLARICLYGHTGSGQPAKNEMDG